MKTTTLPTLNAKRVLKLLVVLTLSGILSTAPAVSAEMGVVWSSSFDDSDEYPWTYYSYSWNGGVDLFTAIDPVGEVVDGALSIADDTRGETFLRFHEAWHPSTVAVGTWSFDYYVDEGRAYDLIAFMLNDYRGEYNWDGIGQKDSQTTGYMLFIIGHETGGYTEGVPKIMLAEMSYPDFEFAVIDEIIIEANSLEGWNHVEITRDVDGLMNVYFNGTQTLQATDTTTTTSEAIWFGSWKGNPKLDNFVVETDKGVITSTVTATVPVIITETSTETDTVTTTVESSAPVLFMILALPILAVRRR